jgi:hypothetical protein
MHASFYVLFTVLLCVHVFVNHLTSYIFTLDGSSRIGLIRCLATIAWPA